MRRRGGLAVAPLHDIARVGHRAPRRKRETLARVVRDRSGMTVTQSSAPLEVARSGPPSRSARVPDDVRCCVTPSPQGQGKLLCNVTPAIEHGAQDGSRKRLVVRGYRPNNGGRVQWSEREPFWNTKTGPGSFPFGMRCVKKNSRMQECDSGLTGEDGSTLLPPPAVRSSTSGRGMAEGSPSR
jgi:hypothetical protein